MSVIRSSRAAPIAAMRSGFASAHGLAAEELLITVCRAAAAARCAGCCRYSARRCPPGQRARAVSGRRADRGDGRGRDRRGRARLARQPDRGAAARRKVRRLCRQPRRARGIRLGGAGAGDGAPADGRRLSPQPADRGAARPRSEGPPGEPGQSDARPTAGRRNVARALRARAAGRGGRSADPRRTGSRAHRAGYDEAVRRLGAGGMAPSLRAADKVLEIVGAYRAGAVKSTNASRRNGAWQ